MSEERLEQAAPSRKRAPRQEKAHEPKKRPPRISMSAGLKLVIPPEFANDKTHYYRYITDVNGRVQRAEQAYYERVKDERGNDIIVKHAVDHYLMRLPIEYRQEDVALKEAKIADTLKAEQKLKEGEYIPEGNKAPLQRDSDLLDPLAS